MNDMIASDIHHQLVNLNKTLDLICKSLKLMAEGDLPNDITITMELGLMFDEDKFYMNQLGRYKLVLTAEKIAEFINYCENNDDAFFMEFEQILKNAEKTDDPCTLPKEKETQ